MEAGRKEAQVVPLTGDGEIERSCPRCKVLSYGAAGDFARLCPSCSSPLYGEDGDDDDDGPDPSQVIDANKWGAIVRGMLEAADRGELDEWARRSLFERFLLLCEVLDEDVAAEEKMRFAVDLDRAAPDLPRFAHPQRPDDPEAEAEWVAWLEQCDREDAVRRAEVTPEPESVGQANGPHKAA